MAVSLYLVTHEPHTLKALGTNSQDGGGGGGGLVLTLYSYFNTKMPFPDHIRRNWD